ncbi:PH domain-containing protein [Terribacillus saccharophilus]|uniref:PH domain-containing protein n=1 Tax=Terribacillus saccharophilus TaxID=361277 RepID=UPI002DCF0959|nr:PH domain-containing protein [Terribacillus saccharophilus]MEC0289604.1 PH domain-containing protein [Terribacillus saccharophilus]
MKSQPRNRIAVNAKKVWRINASLYMLLPVIAAGVLTYFWNTWSIPDSFIYIAWAIIIACLIFFIWLLPALRWRRWRYEVFEQEIYIQSGIFVVTQTIVPMIRVQHVDTEQGPVLKKFGLATVSVSTAATTHNIPALALEEALELRDRIGILARVEEEDV